jgi:hypothetical protein
MFGVFNEFGQIAEFETREEADAFAKEENESDPDSCWVLYTFSIGGSGYPKG